MWVLMVFLISFDGGAAITQTTYHTEAKCDQAVTRIEGARTVRSVVSAVCIYVDAMP